MTPSWHILVNGFPVAAVPGQSVAGALMAAGILQFRVSPRSGSARGAFCMMGSCQECVLEIGGVPMPICQVPVRHGLEVVLSQPG